MCLPITAACSAGGNIDVQGGCDNGQCMRDLVALLMQRTKCNNKNLTDTNLGSKCYFATKAL